MKAIFNHSATKKLTGSRLGSLFCDDPLAKLTLWLDLFGVLKQKEDQEKLLLTTGNILEDKIFNWYNENNNKHWVSYDIEALRYDQFHAEGSDAIFAGAMDGVPLFDNYDFLEIKTASLDKLDWKFNDDRSFSLQKDKNGRPYIKKALGGIRKWYPTSEDEVVIPFNYLVQAKLYAYLSKNMKCTFLVYFVQVDDYLHPELVDVSTTKVISLPNFDLVQIKQDIIEPALKFWLDHVATKTSWELSNKEIELINKEYKDIITLID